MTMNNYNIRLDMNLLGVGIVGLVMSVIVIRHLLTTEKDEKNYHLVLYLVGVFPLSVFLTFRGLKTLILYLWN